MELNGALDGRCNVRLGWGRGGGGRIYPFSNLLSDICLKLIGDILFGM